MTDARAIGVELVGMGKRFGALAALEDVSMRVAAGSLHALLGENGAGKSTLVKCLMGYHRPSAGQVVVDGRERAIGDPRAAHALGLGMVYQHFTLAPSMSGLENLLIAADEVPAVIPLARERERIDAFLDAMPSFRVDLDRPAGRLAAGERQKLEILKQLWLGRRFLVLDEPTSVLTPQEADEVLGHVRALCDAGRITVLMITHKFREVNAFAETVTVLRRGRHAGGGAVASLSTDDMARMMVGPGAAPAVVAETGPAAVSAALERRSREPPSGAADDRARAAPPGGTVPAAGGAEPVKARPVLRLADARANDRGGRPTIVIDRLEVRAGEIVGVAGVAGNGQGELVELLGGQRRLLGGTLEVDGERFRATRREQRRHGVRFLPEEPLANACAPDMSLVENLALRDFDLDDEGRSRFWLDRASMRRRAHAMIEAFGVRAASPELPIRSLSGGNVQRAVLARELGGRTGDELALLIAANPCFGLDFGAVAEIHARLRRARDAGAAVLLVSEDLDEILALADRVLVMSGGRIVFETPAAVADRTALGRHMAERAA